MTEPVSTALLLLLVGMLTVFIILTFVVWTGRTVIWLSNRFDLSSGGGTNASELGNTRIHQKKIAAIAAAVNVVSDGKGRIARIKKLG